MWNFKRSMTCWGHCIWSPSNHGFKIVLVSKFPNFQTSQTLMKWAQNTCPHQWPIGRLWATSKCNARNVQWQTPKGEAFSGVNRSETGEPTSEQEEGVLVGVATDSSCKSKQEWLLLARFQFYITIVMPIMNVMLLTLLQWIISTCAQCTLLQCNTSDMHSGKGVLTVLAVIADGGWCCQAKCPRILHCKASNCYDREKNNHTWKVQVCCSKISSCICWTRIPYPSQFCLDLSLLYFSCLCFQGP